MDVFETQRKLARETIGRKTTRMVGHEILGLGDILSILTSPEILPSLETLIEATKLDPQNREI